MVGFVGVLEGKGFHILPTFNVITFGFCRMIDINAMKFSLILYAFPCEGRSINWQVRPIAQIHPLYTFAV